MSQRANRLDYAPAWRDFRRRLFLVFVLFLSFPFTTAAVVNTWGPERMDYVGAAYVLVGNVVALYALAFRCPRCGRSFYTWVRFVWGWPFVRRCAHCGLHSGARE